MPYISKPEVGWFRLQFIPKRFVNRETSGRIVYLRELSCDNCQRRLSMKYQRIYLALSVLLLASLACQTLSGGSGGGGDQPAVATNAGDSNPPVESTTDPGSAGSGATSDSGFPMTGDAFNVTELGDGSLLYYTKLSLEDVMAFYRTEYTSQGYTEREILTSVSEGVFSMVFDGDASGKAVVIQSVDLGDGSRTVSIRLEAV